MATREYTFTVWGKEYRTDMDTLRVLGDVMQAAMTSGDCSAVAAMIALGTTTGRIVEIGPVIPAQAGIAVSYGARAA